MQRPWGRRNVCELKDWKCHECDWSTENKDGGRGSRGQRDDQHKRTLANQDERSKRKKMWFLPKFTRQSMYQENFMLGKQHLLPSWAVHWVYQQLNRAPTSVRHGVPHSLGASCRAAGHPQNLLMRGRMQKLQVGETVSVIQFLTTLGTRYVGNKEVERPLDSL